MINYRLALQYDGTDFCGWQIQGAGERTVQGELTRVLTLVDGRHVTIHGAGRTDAGVHAEIQVASVMLEHEFAPEQLRSAINGNVEGDLRVMTVAIAPPDFNARYHSTGKTYRYCIVNARVMPPLWRRTALREGRPLDLAAMRDCLPLLIGSHDWSAFSSSQTKVRHHVRNLTLLTIDDEPMPAHEGRLITITAAAQGFVRYMVRGIAGALLAVGRGEVAPSDLSEALKSGIRPPFCATAAAHGLTLIKVHYD
jgi:tRNA pseudouridine38-40 synthase